MKDDAMLRYITRIASLKLRVAAVDVIAGQGREPRG